MLKKLWPVISAVLIIGAFVIGLYLGKGLKPADPDPVIDPDPTPAVSQIDEDGVYDSKEDVALYIHTYNKLPSNYVTKGEARKAGWTGGSVEKYFPNCCIGGDSFANREGLLPKKSGRSYYECDIDTLGKKSRGDKRIIYSNDGLVYYTDDHYESFTLLYGEE
ncbi:MAG: ribonuclease [Erysipelotrichaceae bacterium]|nr:ribonuclease [Erysipelotrichaceae bacterium]